MDHKSFEITVHASYAFDVCRKEIMEFEQCRENGTALPENPEKCLKHARGVISCYEKAAKVEPICQNAFNESRECLFKSDNNIYNCQHALRSYTQCQKNPKEYQEWLAASTSVQKQPASYDFFRYTGTYDLK